MLAPRLCRSACLLVSLSLPALPAQAWERIPRDITGFTGITLGGDVDLVLTQGEEFSVAIESTYDRTGRVLTAVEDGVLGIRAKSANINILTWFEHHTAYVTLPVLESLHAGGRLGRGGERQRLFDDSSFGRE